MWSLVRQDILTLIDCEIERGTICTAGLQQGDITKRSADDQRRLYRHCTTQHLAALLRRQGVEASSFFVRGKALFALREVAGNPERVYQAAQALAILQEAASALRQTIQPLPERSCAAAAAAGGSAPPVEFLNTRTVKRVKREPGVSLSPVKPHRPPTPGDEVVIDSGDETDVGEEKTASEEEDSNFLDGLLSPELPPEL